MAKHKVDIAIKARDEASKKFLRVGKSASSMGSMIKKAVAAAAVYLSVRAIARFTRESLQLYGRQEAAVMGLSDALNLLGKGGRDVMKDMQDFASSIQKVTVHGDEAVLELMAMGASMGKLSGQELKDAVKAAIGLAKAYGIDVVASMRLVARARVGDTATLAKYGIKLGENLTAQEKFNMVMVIGARNFKLAEGETKTYIGAVKQMKCALGDVKEEIGKGLLPIFKESAIRIKEWAIQNQERIGKWAQRTVNCVELIKDVFKSFIDFMKQDWIAGFKSVFNMGLEIVIAFGRSLIDVMDKAMKDLWSNIGVHMMRGLERWYNYQQAMTEALKKEGVSWYLAEHPIQSAMMGLIEKETLNRARERARQQIEEIERSGFYERAYPKVTTPSWGQIGQQFLANIQEAMKNIQNIAPELSSNIMDIFRMYSERATALAMSGALPGEEGKAGGGPRTIAEAVENAIGGGPRGLAAQEARFLTFAPGQKFDQTARYLGSIDRRHHQEVRLLEKIAKVLGTELPDRRRRPEREVAVTNFA